LETSAGKKIGRVAEKSAEKPTTAVRQFDTNNSQLFSR
jgi:hypothetical protein